MATINGCTVNGYSIFRHRGTYGVRGGKSALLGRLAAIAKEIRPAIEKKYAYLDRNHTNNLSGPLYFLGSRFNDDVSVAHRALSGIVRRLPRSVMPKWDVTAEVERFVFENLSGTFYSYVEASLIDSASADHWYTFEKDWGDNY